MDHQLREAYDKQLVGGRVLSKDWLPDLEYYPSLIGHAEFVVATLSTMIVEAGLLDQRVLILAYDDGTHTVSEDTRMQFDHLDGVDRIAGFTVAHSRGEMERLVVEFLASPKASGSIREQMRQWLYFDEQCYAERLNELVSTMNANATDL